MPDLWLDHKNYVKSDWRDLLLLQPQCLALVNLHPLILYKFLSICPFHDFEQACCQLNLTLDSWPCSTGRVWCPMFLVGLFFWGMECPDVPYYPVFKLQSSMQNLCFSRLSGLHQSSYMSALRSPVKSGSSESLSFPKWLDLCDFLESWFCSLWDLRSLALALMEYMTVQLVWIVSIRAGKKESHNTTWGIYMCIYLGIITWVFDSLVSRSSLYSNI